MKTMCPSGYHHSYFMVITTVTRALGHMIYGYETADRLPKTMNYSKAIVVIIRKTRCFYDFLYA